MLTKEVLTMAVGPSIDEIMSAVEESGYLMEQQVATQLEKFGFHVKTNVAFEDQDEGKSREMDVRAIKHYAYNEELRLAAFAELIVECKNSTNPFVLIARAKNEIDWRKPPEEFIFPYKYQMKKTDYAGQTLTKEIHPFIHLEFDKTYYERQNLWKAVQFCRIDRKGRGWHANHGGLYDAIFYPMAKAVTAQKAEVARNTRHGEWRYFWFFFPLIVTSGNLMLINVMDSNPVPLSINHANFVREIKSGKLSGSFSLSFVQQQHLNNFVAEVVEPVGALANDLINNRPHFLKLTTLNWAD